MAAGKEIRGKIKSFENTKKITKAMEMVAASKMRKAQDRMRAARPYADKIRIITANLSQATPEYKHPFVVKNSGTGQVGLIVVSTDKGLCGGLNTNVLRVVTNKMRELEAAGTKVQAVAIGNKGLGFLNRVGAKVVAQATQLGDVPHLEKLIGPVKILLDQYAEGKLDARRYKSVRMHRIDGGSVLAPFGADSKLRADLAFVRKLFALGRTAGQEWLHAHRKDVGVRPSIKIADNA